MGLAGMGQCIGGEWWNKDCLKFQTFERYKTCPPDEPQAPRLNDLNPGVVRPKGENRWNRK